MIVTKVIKTLCWGMVLLWLSVNASRGVVEVWEEGGFWKVTLCGLIFCGASLWCFGVWAVWNIKKQVTTPSSENKGN